MTANYGAYQMKMIINLDKLNVLPNSNEINFLLQSIYVLINHSKDADGHAHKIVSIIDEA